MISVSTSDSAQSTAEPDSLVFVDRPPLLQSWSNITKNTNSKYKTAGLITTNEVMFML